MDRQDLIVYKSRLFICKFLYILLIFVSLTSSGEHFVHLNISPFVDRSFNHCTTKDIGRDKRNSIKIELGFVVILFMLLATLLQLCIAKTQQLQFNSSQYLCILSHEHVDCVYTF